LNERGTTGRLMRLPAAQRWPLIIGMLLLSASAFFPLYVMASNAFRTNLDWANSQIGLPTTASLDAFRRAWDGASIGSSFVNSIEISVGTVVLSVAVATMAAYACSKIACRGHQAIFLFLLFWIVVPPLVLLVPVYIELASMPLIHTNLLDSKLGIVLVYTSVNLPFNVYLMTAYFRSLPDELLDGNRQRLGAGRREDEQREHELVPRPQEVEDRERRQRRARQRHHHEGERLRHGGAVDPRRLQQLVGQRPEVGRHQIDVERQVD